jgi:hypothetical protein
VKTATRSNDVSRRRPTDADFRAAWPERPGESQEQKALEAAAEQLWPTVWTLDSDISVEESAQHCRELAARVVSTYLAVLEVRGES